MERNEIIDKLKKYFNIKELVCPHVYAKFREAGWMFLSTALLHTLLIIREDIVKRPMIVNSGSIFTQRGLRCNMCQLVRSKTSSYLSAHVLGEGLDFSCNDISAEEIRKLIASNSDKLPYKIRFETGVTWVHFDCYDDLDGSKISYFKG